MRTRRHTAYWLGLAIIAILFLRPYPVKFLGNLGVRFIDAMMLALVLFPPLWAHDFRLDRRTIGLASLLVAVTCLAAIATAFSVSVQLSWTEVRDLFETLRYAGLAGYVVFGFFLARQKSFQGHHLLVVLTGVLVVSLLFSLTQKMAPGLARPIIELYAPEHQIRASQATSRVTSIFGNPNTNGFMTLALLLAPLAFFCAVRPLAKHWIPALATLTAGGLYVIIISGSRTSFTTMVAILGIVPLIVGNRKVVAGSFAAISLLFICREQVIEAVHNENAYLADGLKTLLMFDFDSLFTKGTFARRFDHWREAMDFFVSSPLLGAGPLRSRIGSATDNFYIYVLSRYGVLGLGAFVLLWAKVIALCVVGLGRKDANVRFLALFVLALTGAILVGNVSIEAQIIPPIASLYFVTLGAFLGCLYTDERQRSLAPEVA